VPGLINLDFADVKTIMSGMGVAMMGTGVAEGDGRAMLAAQKAVASPLLEDGSVTGARGVIINVTGGPDMSLMEVNEASCVIQEAAHEDANIIFGAVVDPNLGGKIKITVIATGFDKTARAQSDTPTDLTPWKIAADAAVVARAAEQAREAAVAQHAVSAPMASVPVAPAPMVAGSTASGSMGSMPMPQQMTSAQMSNFAPPMTVSRRAPIELSRHSVAASGASGEPTLEFDSQYDVPAFLRRQS